MSLLNSHMGFGTFGSRQLHNVHPIHQLISKADTVAQSIKWLAVPSQLGGSLTLLLDFWPNQVTRIL